MVQAPASFSGTWDDLNAKYIEPNLPVVEQVKRVHAWIKRYCAEPSATYIALHMTPLHSRQQHMIIDGTHSIPAENSRKQ